MSQCVLHVYTNHNLYHANIFQIIIRTLYEVPDQPENNEMVVFRSLHYVPEQSLVFLKTYYVFASCLDNYLDGLELFFPMMLIYY